MKSLLRNTILAVIALLMGHSALAVTLTVSPSVTSNTYPGFITLNITGLTNTEKVVVQRWIDGNANGAVDAGEQMMDTFKISDGGVTIIGGVTNLNAPYDLNSTTGAITTTLNFAASLAVENMTGHFVYVVTSPTGHFAPVTATFVVTNAALNQSITGTIYSNGVPSPYAIVVAQDTKAQNPTGSAIADVNGHYFLTLPAGSYALIGGAINCYFNQSTAPVFTLTNGFSVTNDLFVTGGGTNTISGNVYEAGNSNGLGAILLQFQSGSLFEIAFTDTNGNYSAAVAPAFWKIRPSKERLARRGYVLPEATFQVNATGGGGVTNANIALLKGNALYYGRITDGSGNPFANVEVDAGANNSSGASYAGKGFSDANGYYTAAIMGDLTNNWNCNVNNGKNTAIGAYIFNTFNSNTNVPNQVTLENFTALPATATISGHVQDNSGTNIIGVALSANAFISGNNYQSLDSVTDQSGNYSIAVANGNWNVQFQTGGNDSANLDVRGYEDLSQPHFVNVPPTNAVLNLVVYPIGTPVISQPARFSPTQFNFNISGATNVNYTVQISTNLASTNWTTLTSFSLTSNNFPIVDTHATNRQRFYRAIKN